MWTQAHRATYKQSGTALPSDPLVPTTTLGQRAGQGDPNGEDGYALNVYVAQPSFIRSGRVRPTS